MVKLWNSNVVKLMFGFWSCHQKQLPMFIYLTWYQATWLLFQIFTFSPTGYMASSLTCYISPTSVQMLINTQLVLFHTINFKKIHKKLIKLHSHHHFLNDIIPTIVPTNAMDIFFHGDSLNMCIHPWAVMFHAPVIFLSSTAVCLAQGHAVQLLDSIKHHYCPNVVIYYRCLATISGRDLRGVGKNKEYDQTEASCEVIILFS